MSLQHFRYRKVTPEKLWVMKTLRVQGKTYYEIAEIIGVNYATVAYHLDKNQRENTLKRARRSLVKKDAKPKNEAEKLYGTEYFKDRYHNDPIFRRKVIRANSGGRFSHELLEEIDELRGRG